MGCRISYARVGRAGRCLVVRLGADCNLAVCSELGVTPDGESRRGRDDSRCARLTEPVSSLVPRRYNELTAAPVPECHRRQHLRIDLGRKRKPEEPARPAPRGVGEAGGGLPGPEVLCTNGERFRTGPAGDLKASRQVHTVGHSLTTLATTIMAQTSIWAATRQPFRSRWVWVWQSGETYSSSL